MSFIYVRILAIKNIRVQITDGKELKKRVLRSQHNKNKYLYFVLCA